MNPITKTLKACHFLGWKKLWQYVCYQVGLRSGYYRHKTRPQREVFTGEPGLKPFQCFPSVSEAHQAHAIAQADAVLQGEFHRFGGEPVPLDLNAGSSSLLWTKLEKQAPESDLKFIWEPARFGWAISLARAYAFSQNPDYAKDFWEKTLSFLETHPPYLGRQWQSAQEVAIRLMAMVFCDRVFADAPASIPENRLRLWQAIAEHAQRIPPTLTYARAQNNNHLISEAAGLYTAGVYLPEHPSASKWRAIGWRWLNRAFQHQINEFGTYTQHSTNYHRLMLQLALFTDHLRREAGDIEWEPLTRTRLAIATRWLWALTDPDTGRTPRLGAQDGAYLFQFASLPSEDYRPVVDAAAKSFLDQDVYAQNELAEMAAWFDLHAPKTEEEVQPQASDMLRIESGEGRAFLHTAHFSDRPSHADQLHADLWWKGVNVALDPGTYRYNAPRPWDNALATAHVHNTLTVDGQDQMLRAGRFLWLDWAQAQILTQEVDQAGMLRRITAEHDGYRKLGCLHQRTLERNDDGWLITDDLLPCGKEKTGTHDVHLTWLLPDFPWEHLDAHTYRFTAPSFSFQVLLFGADRLSLFRMGQSISGDLPAEPLWGWTSPRYGEKESALMIKASRRGELPLQIQTLWQFE